MNADATKRANQLYWETERSVNQIAADLDVSKGALYEMIRPRAAGSACPLCGGQLEYANRTAKERNRPACPTCPWEGPSTGSSRGTEQASTPPSPPAAMEHDAPGSEGRGRSIVVGALLGAAVGLALVLWARRK